MTIVNCTPHAITVAGTTYPPSGHVARVSVTLATTGDHADGAPIYTKTYLRDAVTGLPAAERGTRYIVSAMVLEELRRTRGDLLAPATGHPDVIRDEAGHIVSVPGWVR